MMVAPTPPTRSDMQNQEYKQQDVDHENNGGDLPVIWDLSLAPRITRYLITPTNPLIRLTYTSMLNPSARNVQSIRRFIRLANENNPRKGIGGWLWVSDDLTRCEQVLEGPMEQVMRLFFGKKVLVDGKVVAETAWKGGIKSDPMHKIGIYKVDYDEEIEMGRGEEEEEEMGAVRGGRMYDCWGMSWAVYDEKKEEEEEEKEEEKGGRTPEPWHGVWLREGGKEDRGETWVQGGQWEEVSGGIVVEDNKGEGGEGGGKGDRK
ncbi:hypothetical protein TrRE_jg8275 [Triparma retinervis]|uniref:BLUF domain-containing protein n=1 Tax=Triparma retinervis TaxID=2557542 RepID=A0A9W7ABK7_9STRA|nr:hypothetical protein TrRE_jg8275 [Triparma retinervis]